MKIELDVLRSVMLAHMTDMLAFVAGTSFKRNGKGLDGFIALRGGVVQHGGGIQSSTQPNSYRSVCDELFLHRIGEQ